MKNKYVQKLSQFFNENWGIFSITSKVYVLIGIMASLIAVELIAMLFAMNFLTAIRAFVMGEGSWSKAQKNAIFEIQNYARTGQIKHYLEFKEYMIVPLGYNRVRIELSQQKPNLDAVRSGFLRGGVLNQDIDPMIELLSNIKNIEKLNIAFAEWGHADELIFKLIQEGETLHGYISRPRTEYSADRIEKSLLNVAKINRQLSIIEDRFSSTLSDGSRWLEKWLFRATFILVFFVWLIGVVLTMIFARNLKMALCELNDFANHVGAGDFSRRVEIRSPDEIGKLTHALNNMALELKERTSESRLAEKSSQIKNLFLANMSHEIRTPLNSILGFVELLKDANLPEPERLRYIEVIERTGNSLATIINDILDISKVEAGKLHVQKSKVSIQQIFSDLETLLGVRSEEKGIYLRFTKKSDIPPLVITDGTRLKQVLLNIVGNAIKFTNTGGVTVSYQLIKNNFFCWVIDTGVGIAAQDKVKLFQPFSQIDLSIRKNYRGTGLGLILSKKIAELLGGDVVLVCSNVNQGSTFLITISLLEGNAQINTVAATDVKAIQHTENFSLSGRKILLVEDSFDNQLLTQKFLSRVGAIVDIANNGQEGVEAARAVKYDLVLMDMQMPVMDGYSAAAELRRSGYNIPIVALTANAMREDLDRCLQSGCNDYLTKPFRHSDLIETMSRHVAR